MSGNVWMFSDQIDDEDIMFMQHEFVTYKMACDRLYNALKRENVPVTIYNGAVISRYLNGEGKVGIVPCFDSPSDYFYGGFADKDVGEIINLPDKNSDSLIQNVQWEPLVEVRLKGKKM